MGRKRWAFGGAVLAMVSAGGVASGDEITHWVDVLNQAIRVHGGAPCPIGRAIAMTTTAMYDAVNSIDRGHRPYLGFFDVPFDASKEAAAAQAARDTLVHLYPAQQAFFDAELASRLALIPNSPAKTAGMSVGQASAAGCIASRVGDGSDNNTPYTFGTNPGDYVTPEDVPPGTMPFTPNWGMSRPFTMTHNNQFLVPPGPAGYTVMSQLLASPEYTAQFNEVKEVGSRNSVTRTLDQTRLAFFWANDVNGTYKPPGHLMNIVKEIAAPLNLSLVQHARLFALAGLAQGDSGVVAWHSKYDTDIDLWRPISGIRRAHTDGNPETIPDPEWLALNPFSPPFPAWISGHSTFGGATAGVLAAYFGTDNMTFSITSEDPFYAALVPPPPPTRSFNRFSDMGWEDAISRVYLGVHWRWDCVDGFTNGHALGTYIGQNFLGIRCSADVDDGSGTGQPDGGVGIDDLLYYLQAFDTGSHDADVDNGSGMGVRDGGVTVDDLLYYLSRFELGC